MTTQQGGAGSLKKVDRSSLSGSLNPDNKPKQQGFGGEVLARLEQLRANVAESDSDSSDSDWDNDD